MDLCAFPERLQLQYRLHAFAMLLTFEQYGGFVGRRPDHVATGKVRIIISINNRSYSLLRKDGGSKWGARCIISTFFKILVDPLRHMLDCLSTKVSRNSGALTCER